MGKQRVYEVTLTGISDLLMHKHDIEFADEISEYRKKNKKKGKAGDDRSPAWSWLGYCYHEDDRLIGLPSDNLMTMLRDGATHVVVSGSKTFKAQSQSGLVVGEEQWPIMVDGHHVPWGPFLSLVGNDDFDAHKQAAADHGFRLFVKGAKVGQSRHVRVRPMFRNWTATGTVIVLDDTITDEVLEQILEMAGAYCGIGDWRPKSPKSPGSFGRFTAAIKGNGSRKVTGAFNKERSK